MAYDLRQMGILEVGHINRAMDDLWPTQARLPKSFLIPRYGFSSPTSK